MDRIDTIEVYDQIIDALKNKKPYSAIRFNDGEAIMLGYPEYTDRQTITNVWRGHFGTNKFTEEKINNLKNILVDSCHKSDVIGLPLPQNIDKKFYGLPEKHLVDDYDLLKNAKASYASFHRELHEKSLYNNILTEVDKVYCINGRNVKDLIESTFGVECEVVQITPQIQNQFTKERHNNHPEIYDEISERVAEKSKGNLWFIGAGFYGKGYCTTIKENGGIAVDIGSMFDAWLGIRTRGFINKTYKL